jgi:hypothetical protein
MADELLQYINTSPFYAGFDLEEKEIRKRFLRNYLILPPKLREFLVSEVTATKIAALSQTFRLSVNQTILLAMIIRYTVSGNLFIGDMPAQISSSLGIDQNTALEIARAITSQLFAPVIEDIKKLQLQKFGKLPGSSTPQPSLQRPPQHIPGEDLPETGGNIIDLRNKS